MPEALAGTRISELNWPTALAGRAQTALFLGAS